MISMQTSSKLLLFLHDRRRRISGHPFKKTTEGGGAFESNGITGVAYIRSVFQQQFRLLYAYRFHVLMRSLTITGLKGTDKMKFGIKCGTGNMINSDVFRKVSIHKSFCSFHLFYQTFIWKNGVVEKCYLVTVITHRCFFGNS